MAVRAIGSNAVVRFVQETTWGTTPGAGTVYGVNLRSETVGSTKNLFQSETINRFRSVIGLGDGNRGVEGDIVMDLLPEGQEVLLAHVLGDTAPTTAGTGPYTHTIQGKATYAEGLSIEKDFENMSPMEYFKYTGCRTNTLAINFIQEGFHDITVGFVGKHEAVGTFVSGGVGDGIQINDTTDPIFPSKSGFTGYQCLVLIKLASASWQAPVGGVYPDALGNVVSGSINITNNMETDGYVLGSDERASCAYGKRQCTGNFTTFFEDLTQYARYVAGTECSIKFLLDNDLGQIMEIEFPIVKLGGESPKIASASGLNLPLTFQARRDDVLGYDVQIKITNTLATPFAA